MVINWYNWYNDEDRGGYKADEKDNDNDDDNGELC